MKIEQFTRGLIDGWPSELRRGGGSVVVNADGSVSVTGATTVTGDLTVTGSINASAAGIILEDDEELFFGTNTDYWFQYRAAGTAFELRSTDVDGAGADGIVWKVEDGTDDVDFTGDITAVNLTGALTGNASTATVLETPRNIGGVSFDGSADIVPQTIQVVVSTDASSSIVMFDSATGNLQPKTDAGLTYDAITGALTATSFVGPLTGAVTGNADTATALETPRDINGVAFDGTAAITVTAAAGTLTGTVLNATVVTSSLTAVAEAAVTAHEAALTVLESQITDGTVFPRLGSTEAITGLWTFSHASGLKTDIINERTGGTGVSIDGVLLKDSVVTAALTGNADTATLAATVTVVDSTDATSFIAMFDEATGSLAVKTDAGLTYDATTGILTATGFAGPLTGAVTGNADSATVLQTPRNIGGVAFDGSAAIVPQTIQVVDSTDASSSIAMFDTATGNLQAKTDAGLTYNASTGVLAATGFAGPLTGAVTGNADTATVLATPRDINGVAFDGSTNITITAAAGTLTGATLNATVTASSLTSLGTIASLVATSADINGGTIDGAVIGGAAVADGSFAVLSATGTLAWGGGATILSSDKVRPDYAAIRFDDNSTAETIDLVDQYHLVTRFATNGLDEVSAADQANNRLTVGDGRDYRVALSGSAEAVGAARTFVFDVFEISQTTANITAITQATPGVVTAAGHGFSNGNLCKITGVVGMVEVNDKIFTVAAVAGDDFSLQDDEGVSIATGGFAAWSSGGTVALATKTFAHSDRTFSNSSGFGSFSSHWFYAATLGDAIEFAIKNKSDASNLTFEHLNLTIEAL